MSGVLNHLRREIRLSLLQAKGYIKSYCGESNEKDVPIDFVVTWVDGNDPAWCAEKAKYFHTSEKGNTEARYREWGQFMYWFRAVEKYAPWVRYVYLVTWGHLPAWLNTNHPKLKIINHRDFIPKEYLPTFNSIPIELNMHRIPGLSEYFVYFNDDMYLSKMVTPADFFLGGLPKYCASAQPVRNSRYNGPFAHIQFTDIGMINGVFDAYSSIEKNPELWFHHSYRREDWLYNKNAYRDAYLPGMCFTHLGCPYRKSTLEKVWITFQPEMEETCRHRFRTYTDVMHQIFSLWEIMDASFVPVSRDYYGRVFGSLSREIRDIRNAFTEGWYRMVCLNDSVDITQENYSQIKAELDDILCEAFPNKSLFEK